MSTPLYLSKPENIRYHTGFIGTFAICLKTERKTYLITDSRYTQQAKKLCYNSIVVKIIDAHKKGQTATDLIKQIIAKHKITEIGFEATHLSYYQALNLRHTYKQVKWLPMGPEVDRLRIIKVEQEISTIQKSQQINEKALQQLVNNHIKIGVTETELAWQIYKIARELGAEDLSFDPIIAFGKNSASPHYTPDPKRKLKKGDVLLIDMGVKYQGYCSDMTRTFFTAPPTAQQTEVYNTVLAAQQAAIKNIQPGQPARAGDKYSRSVIAKAGYGDYFTHANGHGVGLEIHEAPSLSSKPKHKDRNIKLATNMIVTVEPGIYLPDKFGVRIEDMIVIKDGKNKNLTKSPKSINSATLILK